MKNKKIKVEVSRRLKRNRNVALLLYTILIFAVLFGGIVFAKNYTWYDANDPIYIFLKIIEELILIVVPLILIVGYIIIFNRYWNRLSNYLNEVINASNKLFSMDAQRIDLPVQLADVENQFNSMKFEFERNQQIAQEAIQRKNDLIVYLAHDLKTPLTSVIGYLTLVSEEKNIPIATKEKYLDIALNKANRLEDLINEFFEITRFNLSGFELETREVDFSLMIEQLLFEFNAVFNKKNLVVNADIGANIMLNVDIDKMSRAIDNLLINAYNYSFENSQIDLNLHEDANGILLTLKNRGNTIPQSKLERIFVQFYRLDTSRSSTTGKSGLGLAITKEIVELHNGDISVQSWDEQIMFTIEFKK